MIHGFCAVAASAGYGLGHAAVPVRRTPVDDKDTTCRDRIGQEVLPAMASRRGMASDHSFGTLRDPMDQPWDDGDRGRRRRRRCPLASPPQSGVQGVRGAW